MNTIWQPSLGDTHLPKHQALRESISTAITQGQLQAGTRLPPVRELAWKLGITPGTVARAYKDLVDDAVLDAVVGRGTFVAQSRPAIAAAPPPFPDLLPDLIVETAAHEVNMRAAQVADVGQSAIIHTLMQQMPPPRADAYLSYPMLSHEAALRGHLAKWISGVDHGQIEADDLVLSSGAQHAMVLVFQTLLQGMPVQGARPQILTEDLAYPGFRHAAGLVRAAIGGVPFDEEGLIPEALEQACRETGAQILCTSAGAHNPTCIRTSPERRAAIVAIARKHDVQIVDDDCFGFAGSALPSYRLLAPERAWVIATLSKTISPALRVGAIVAPAEQVMAVRIAAQQQFLGLARPLVDLANALFESGKAMQISNDLQALQARRVARVREILGHYATGLRDDVPLAWLRLPRGWRASSYLRAAEAEGIRIKAADEFALIDGRAPNCVRLALNCPVSEARFVQALQVLARLLANPPVEIEV